MLGSRRAGELAGDRVEARPPGLVRNREGQNVAVRIDGFGLKKVFVTNQYLIGRAARDRGW